MLAGAVSVVGIGGASGAATKHKTVPKKINLSGVTLNVGDLAGQTQILLNDSGALKGAQYKVNFATFPAGPPAVAAIQGGSIDLTVTADTPAIFAQAGGTQNDQPIPSLLQAVTKGLGEVVVVLVGIGMQAIAEAGAQIDWQTVQVADDGRRRETGGQ